MFVNENSKKMKIFDVVLIIIVALLFTTVIMGATLHGSTYKSCDHYGVEYKKYEQKERTAKSHIEAKMYRRLKEKYLNQYNACLRNGPLQQYKGYR